MVSSPNPLTQVNDRHQFIHRQVKSLIEAAEFPCVGAKSAFKRGTYALGIYKSMTDAGAIKGLCHDLLQFVLEQKEMGGDFTTFISCFENPVIIGEDDFEDRLWQVLQQMHDEDKIHHQWDPFVSSDPENPGFTFSFGGRAYFIVGLHPASSRYARRFAYPTLVFNAQFQFEKLKEFSRFDKMQEIIRERDARINDGTINPNLGNLFEVSAAGQIGTKPKDEAWKCPFHY